MRPLDFLGSIKLKLGVVIVAAVAVTVVVMLLGDRAGLSPLVTGLGAAALALAMVQVLAHGMTFPLREMVSAARAMAKGDYGRRVTATSRDEVGELARAFNAMATELEQVERMRRDLVANVSHELRTPISALRALLENLIDGVEPVERSTLETTLRQVERLGALVEQLLELSKLESGAVPLERRRIDLRPVAEQVVEESRGAADSRGVGLSVEGDAEVGLRADEHRLHQVVANRVSTAGRPSRRGGGVRRRGVGDDGRALLEVSDEGPGIAAEEAERVFERFYRSDQGRAATEGGSGLGLAIARWIVELHGGAIRVEAIEPHGCRMVVELPR